MPHGEPEAGSRAGPLVATTALKKCSRCAGSMPCPLSRALTTALPDSSVRPRPGFALAGWLRGDVESGSRNLTVTASNVAWDLDATKFESAAVVSALSAPRSVYVAP